MILMILMMLIMSLDDELTMSFLYLCSQQLRGDFQAQKKM